MPQRFHAWLLENAEKIILRWIFRSALLVAIAVLAVDLAGTQGWIVFPDPAATPPAEIREDSPALKLPAIVPSILAPLLPDGDKRLVPLPQPEGAIAQPMTFELVGGGRLMATGTITPGISQGFAAEIERRGEYIKTVVLNSPGGSVSDALAMGRLIRESRFARRRQGRDRRAPGGGDAFGGQRSSPRRDEHSAKHLRALPALSRRDGRQPSGLGARHGDAARQVVRLQAG